MAKLQPLGGNAVHIVVDMQRIFAEPGGWHVASIPDIVPNIVTLLEAFPHRSLFTRFVVPQYPEEAPGRWRHYYERWREFTLAHMDPGKIEIVPELASYAEGSVTFDKLTYSAFDVPAFVARLDELRADTLVFSGVETDVCVLGTLLPAVDRGYRAVAVSDAMTSSSVAGHEATLTSVLTRLDVQVDVATTREVLAALG